MAQPLAERMRPKTLDEYIGQKHLVGEGPCCAGCLKRADFFVYLWGPPGVGKTTLAQIVANRLEVPFYTLSAVTSGVKEVREVIEKAKPTVSILSKVRYCLLMKFTVSVSHSRTRCWERSKREW